MAQPNTETYTSPASKLAIELTPEEFKDFSSALDILASVTDLSKIPTDWQASRADVDFDATSRDYKKKFEGLRVISNQVNADEPDVRKIASALQQVLSNGTMKLTTEGFGDAFQATQAGGKFGPDAVEKGVKNIFTKDKSKSTAKKTKNTGGKKAKPAKKASADKNIRDFNNIPDMASFKDKAGMLYTFDANQKKWTSRDGSKDLDPKQGAMAYNKAREKSKLESKDQHMDKEIKEGLADLAKQVEHDHEVQMARADLYKLAKYSIKLHEMLKTVSETEGIKGWQQSKITKASDYISSVYHNLDYEMKFGSQGDLGEGKSPHKKGTKKYKKHMAAKHASMAENDSYKSSLRARLAERKDKIR